MYNMVGRKRKRESEGEREESRGKDGFEVQ
jgi:hypothetical protein